MSASLLPVALGASALLLVSGGLVARFWPSAPPTAAIAAPVAAAAPAAPEAAAEQTLVVASPADIAVTLRAAGIAADVADGAAQEVRSVLGRATGTIRLVVDLTGPANAREMTRLEATRDRSGVVLTAKPDGSYSSEPTQARLTTAM